MESLGGVPAALGSCDAVCKVAGDCVWSGVGLFGMVLMAFAFAR